MGKAQGQEVPDWGPAIVNEIMKAHYGTVSVEDRPEGGTVFTLRFPLVD